MADDPKLDAYLVAESGKELAVLAVEGVTMEFRLEPTSALCLISQLQLALRHPGNTSAAALVALMTNAEGHVTRRHT